MNLAVIAEGTTADMRVSSEPCGMRELEEDLVNPLIREAGMPWRPACNFSSTGETAVVSIDRSSISQ